MALDPFIGYSLTLLLSKWMAPKQEKAKPAGLSDFDIPTAEEGRVLPVAMGTNLLKNANITWYGDLETKEHVERLYSKMIPMMFIYSVIDFIFTKEGPKANPAARNAEMKIIPWIIALFAQNHIYTDVPKGFKYWLSVHMTLCAGGPGLTVKRIRIDEKDVWNGSISDTVQPHGDTVKIDNPALFGGDDQGGGVVGNVSVYPGSATQPANSYLRRIVSSLFPAYRYVCHAVLEHVYIGKSPSLRPWAFEVRWIPNRLGLGAIGDDANPCEMIYEILINDFWGLGEDADLIDKDAFIAAGQTLRTEGQGLSLVFDSQTGADAAIKVINRHVNGVYYVDPETGKIVYKLIRNDYDITAIPIFDTRQIKSIRYKRLSWDETFNEIVVNYTDRSKNYTNRSVPGQDLGNIYTQEGKVVTDTVDLNGFTTEKNAQNALERELRSRSYPLAAVTLEINRTANRLVLGSVFRLNWEPYGIYGLVFRVTNVKRGTFTDNTISIDAVEDVFSLDYQVYINPPASGWEDPVGLPVPVRYQTVFETPYWLQRSEDIRLTVAAARPGTQTIGFDIWQAVPNGWASTNAATGFSPAGLLLQAVDALTEAVIETDVLIIQDVGLGSMEGLESIPEAEWKAGWNLVLVDEEFMAWRDIRRLENGAYAVHGVIRGVLDTVPAAHPAGRIIYFIGNTATTQQYPYLQPGPVSVKLATRTIGETLPVEDATAMAITTRERAKRPIPPGRVRQADFVQQDCLFLSATTGDVTLHYEPRNRLNTGMISQDELEIEAEEGTTYRVKAYINNVRVRTEDTDQLQFTYSWVKRLADHSNLDLPVTLELYAVRDGFESYQGQKRTFVMQMPVVYEIAGEAEIPTLLADWVVEDHFHIPWLNHDAFVNEGVYILLAEPCDSIEPGAMRIDDAYYKPDGRLVVATGLEAFSIQTVEPGFVVLYPEHGKYRWNGTTWTLLTEEG